MHSYMYIFSPNQEFIDVCILPNKAVQEANSVLPSDFLLLSAPYYCPHPSSSLF